MDDEKLIEYVRDYEKFYNLAHSQYLNGNYKDKKWAEIAKKLEQPVAACKARWNNIRDNFRKSLKKRITKSGQAAVKFKKYKYEDQLSFLVPFMKEIETKSNLNKAEKILDNENDEDQYNDDDNDDSEEEPVKNVENLNQNIDDVTISNLSSSSSSSLKFYKERKVESTKSKFKSPETASATLMKYMLERNEKKSQRVIHPVDAFLAGLAPTLKSLSSYHLNIAKSKFFNIVQEIEMDQITHMQQKYATPPETSSFISSSPSPSPSPNYTTPPSTSIPAISPTINSKHTWPAEFSTFNSSYKNYSIKLFLLY
ncbi:bromodomain-containing protein DDB_G0270170-like [Formica exsecta]|uniref:bromodomain-containing protein DDB_G0270170-like n=1 Tax=Formica exsecta TaxID=72781 RepID=UPI0011421669|nr:bromodomain-containing protein DDB_G0270170-like [Formica exsecta]